jgi:hypothetical protein
VPDHIFKLKNCSVTALEHCKVARAN